MSDDDRKGPVGQAVEALVYAPIGLFFEGPRLLPELIQQGKTHARNARVFGKFAVQHGQGELRRRLATFEEQATDVLRAFGVTGDGSDSAPSSAPSTPSSATAGSAASAGSAPSAGSPAGDGDVSPTVGELAITDYDSLSASQVVTRLAGLAGDELEAVRAYEVAHRGRKTILNKIAQLQT
jgi:hypothetical protein